MIKKITIKNFQSHRDTEIEPSPGVNVIVGRNMTGKSALLRALRLLFFNKPEGSDFVSWGAKNAEIEIEYGDHTIRRIKGKRTNIYEVDGSEFKNFGKGVPDDVARALGVFPIRIADATYELTIEGPHEPPFLVSETDAVKGKIFAELAEQLLGDLVRLDKAISTSNVKLRTMNSDTKVLGEEIISAEESLRQFEPVKGTDKKLKMCHNLLSRAQETQDNLNGLIECREDLSRINQDLSASQSLSGVYDLGDLDSQLVDARELHEEAAKLALVKVQLHQMGISLGELQSHKVVLETIPDYAEVSSLAIELRSLRAVASELADIDDVRSQLYHDISKATIPDLAEAETLVTELQSLRAVASELKSVDESIHRLGHDYSKVATALSMEVNDYGELLLEEKRCPICFGPVDEHDAERIIQELTGNGSGGDTEEG